MDPNSLFKDLVYEKYYDLIQFYTDGSTSIDVSLAGCAVFCPSANFSRKWKIPIIAYIFSIEAIAILYTLGYIITKVISEVIIFSHPLSVLQNNDFIKSGFILHIRNRLIILNEVNRIISLINFVKNIGFLPFMVLVNGLSQSAI